MAAAFNRTTEEEKLKRQEILKALLGSMGEWTELYPSIQFDYGCNTYLGSRVLCDFQCYISGLCRNPIGGTMFVGPDASFLTPIHPLLARERILWFTSEGRPYTKEACKPISVGDRVWIGGNAVILPGVTIGIRYRHWCGQRGDEKHPCRSARRGKSLPGSAGNLREG